MSIIIKHTNYEIGVHYFEFAESVNSLGLEEPLIGDLKLKCRMDKSFSQIVFDCNLEVAANLECDRCTGEYDSVLKNEFEIVYLFSDESIEDDELNVHYLAPEADKIDLTPDVVEIAKLSIPMKNLCDEDCKGLCPKCGADLNETNCDCDKENINPIWDKLKELKNKNE